MLKIQRCPTQAGTDPKHPFVGDLAASSLSLSKV
jgi:hypothetical protein